jgi:hypothetical protein
MRKEGRERKGEEGEEGRGRERKGEEEGGGRDY